MSFGLCLARALLCVMFLMLSISCSHSAHAASSSSVLDKDWQKTFSLIKNKQDPVAQKLVIWLYATETNIGSDAEGLIAFIRQNPDWPRLHILRRKIESGISPAKAAHEIATWFDQHPPQTADGMKAYLQALLNLGMAEKASHALSIFWSDASISKNETAALAGAYKKYFRVADHATRLDNLVWNERYGEAEYMLAFVDADVRALARARLALARMEKNADALLQKVPQHLQNNEGLLFERTRWRRRKNMDDRAVEMITQVKRQTRPEKWWEEIHILARRQIERGNYKKAHAITALHQTVTGSEFASAEWLLGWLALQHLNDASAATLHFDAVYKNVNSAISRSRAAYWAGRAAAKLKKDADAQQWFQRAAAYPSTYYGQLSIERIAGLDARALFKPTLTAADAVAAFEKNELVRAIRLLQTAGLVKLATPFFARLRAEAKTTQDYALIAKLAHDIESLYFAVEANKDAQQFSQTFVFDHGYPVFHDLPPTVVEKSLVHAIIYRESMFDTEAISPAGARGLMQLMPATAQETARKNNLRYGKAYLTDDPKLNIMLGSAYLQKLIDRYDGFYPMAIAAYNAGPGRVDQWISTFGDPRRGDIDPLDWIESIPIYETRNYVQRVMESYFVYRIKFSLAPQTVTAFIRL